MSERLKSQIIEQQRIVAEARARLDALEKELDEFEWRVRRQDMMIAYGVEIHKHDRVWGADELLAYLLEAYGDRPWVCEFHHVEHRVKWQSDTSNGVRVGYSLHAIDTRISWNPADRQWWISGIPPAVVAACRRAWLEREGV